MQQTQRVSSGLANLEITDILDQMKVYLGHLVDGIGLRSEGHVRSADSICVYSAFQEIFKKCGHDGGQINGAEAGKGPHGQWRCFVCVRREMLKHVCVLRRIRKWMERQCACTRGNG